MPVERRESREDVQHAGQMCHLSCRDVYDVYKDALLSAPELDLAG
jgi:hypothetical protein